MRAEGPGRSGINNRLMLAMEEATFERLRPALHPLALLQGQLIDHVNGPFEYLYFVNRGFVSMVKTMRDGRSVEVGGIGLEGLTAPNSLFGIETAVFDAMVQIPGNGFRVQREALKKELDRDPALRELFQNYARFVLSQLGQTAACNRLHSVEERCCRWLLIAHDNAMADSFPLTHEFLAMMLGVQRAGVSIAARILKRAGLIDYTRGRVTILDRRGIEEIACECYQDCRDELDVLFAAYGSPGAKVGLRA
jgi:CRP-like cAMP-binding protein